MEPIHHIVNFVYLIFWGEPHVHCQIFYQQESDVGALENKINDGQIEEVILQVCYLSLWI